MFCPNCRYEYEPGVTVCRDCGTPLVAELPPKDEPEVEYVDLVTVYTTINMSDVLIAKSILEDAGIWYFVKGKAFLSGFAGDYGPSEFQVRPEDEADAREALAALEAGQAEELSDSLNGPEQEE